MTSTRTRDFPSIAVKAPAQMLIRAKAPLRISFAGGGTDISPYPKEHGGHVLTCTIDKYSYVTIIPHDSSSIAVRSLDYDIFTRYSYKKNPSYNGKLDLVKAALKVMGVDQGAEIFMHSDLPPGAGLGASSSMTVALVGAISHWQNQNLTNYQIADLAYHIEREELAIKGGKQDQYASTFGGFNFIEFFANRTVVNPLRVENSVLNELQYRLMLCFTGTRRLSSGIIEDQMAGYVQNNQDVISALYETNRLASEIKNAMLPGELDEVGRLLHRGWMAKKRFTRKMTDQHMDKLYEMAISNGALGGKLLGAGGGGYFLLFCEFNKWQKVAEELEKLGGKVTNFNFEFEGLQTWEAKI
jgi:D-glycero-alpha-D-manno-heptose-7-phosphate kinase